MAISFHLPLRASRFFFKRLRIQIAIEKSSKLKGQNSTWQAPEKAEIRLQDAPYFNLVFILITEKGLVTSDFFCLHFRPATFQSSCCFLTPLPSQALHFLQGEVTEWQLYACFIQTLYAWRKCSKLQCLILEVKKK